MAGAAFTSPISECGDSSSRLGLFDCGNEQGHIAGKRIALEHTCDRSHLATKLEMYNPKGGVWPILFFAKLLLEGIYLPAIV